MGAAVGVGGVGRREDMRMGQAGRWAVAAVLLAATCGVDVAHAGDNPNGSVFRAVAWVKGRSTVSAGVITCEVPTITSAIFEGFAAVGMWNTYGLQTLFFPDPNNALANPCGGWMELQSNLIDQALNVEEVRLKFAIKGANRFRSQVATRNAFPVACRQFRKETLFAGIRLDPVNATVSSSISGAPNVGFVQVLPMVSPQLVHCLRDQYAALPTSLFASLPLVITATTVGTADSGKRYVSNSIRYTLNLRHTCGNGRIDDGEQCDPLAPTSCVGFCKIQQGQTVGECSNDALRGCRSDPDCIGLCYDSNQPTECVCIY
jgi:hypothetical protein